MINTVTCLVTTGGVWIGNRIYRSLTTLSYKQQQTLAEIHSLQFTMTLLSLLNLLCLYQFPVVTAYNGRHSLSFWFPNVPLASATGTLD
jgi:hypothetical protein